MIDNTAFLTEFQVVHNNFRLSEGGVLGLKLPTMLLLK